MRVPLLMPLPLRGASRRVLLAVALMGAAALCSPARAAFPEKPVVLVAPFPPGGAADVLSRLLAKQLEPELGKPVVVENKPGGGTAIGAIAVANAKADGYTLLISSNSTWSMNPALNPKVGYDAAQAFEPIGQVATVGFAAIVSASHPARTVAQFVAAAKAAPDKFVYGSFGNGTAANFVGAMFMEATGLSMPHVAYKGSAAQMTDLIGGQIPLIFDTVVAATPQVKGGKVRVLAVTTAKRSGLLPDAPTMAESGFAGFDFSSWITVVAPRGLPADVKKKLESALAAVMAKPETLEKMRAAGFEPGWATYSDWAGTVTRDVARMKAIIERAQIKAD